MSSVFSSWVKEFTTSKANARRGPWGWCEGFCCSSNGGGTLAAKAIEPQEAAAPSTTFPWICHRRVRGTGPCLEHAPLTPPIAITATTGLHAPNTSLLDELMPSEGLGNILLFPEESLCVFQTHAWNEIIGITSRFHPLKPQERAFLPDKDTHIAAVRFRLWKCCSGLSFMSTSHVDSHLLEWKIHGDKAMNLQ